MKFWLLKSEPVKYSWEKLVIDKKTVWDGIRNYAARNFLKEMSVGDEAFFYHSNEGKEIVGICKIVKTAYQDPTTPEPAWVSVDVSPLKKLKKPVTLQEIKNENNLTKMILVNNTRLSVQPVLKKEWEIIMKMSGE